MTEGARAKAPAARVAWAVRAATGGSGRDPTLTVSGGGLTTVSTDGILEDASALEHLGASAGEWRRRLEAARSYAAAVEWRPVTTGLVLTSSVEELEARRAAAAACAALAAARESAGRAAQAATDLAGRLRIAARSYGDADRAATSFDEQVGSLIGWTLGRFAPVILAAAAMTVLVVGTAGLLTGRSGSTDRRTAVRFIGRHQGLLADPKMVRLVRATVSSVDNAALGGAGVPWGLTRVLDDRSTGLFGLHGATALIVAGAAGTGALHETPVTVHRTSVGTARAPAGFGDVAARIPPNAVGSPQIRIERYDVPGGRPRFIAYLGGTIDAGFVATKEPWDDTSNIRGVGRLDPGSARAARRALTEAGAHPGDAVLSVGYSQGGIVATDLAANEAGGAGYASEGVITFGSPTDQVRLPEGVPAVAVEHREDIVPALGGEPLAAERGGLTRTIVERSALTAPAAPDDAFAGHHLELYEHTAAMMDDSADPRLVGMVDRLHAVTADRAATVTTWRADRSVAATAPNQRAAPSGPRSPTAPSLSTAPSLLSVPMTADIPGMRLSGSGGSAGEGSIP